MNSRGPSAVHSDSHGLGSHLHVSTQGLTGILGLSMLATFALVITELVAGYAGNSMALVSDAVHNLTDVPTLVISWLAMRLTLRPPTSEKTYGYHRAGVLAAFVNAIVLALISVFLLYESISRMRRPVEVETRIMLWVALAALIVNGGIALAVNRGREDLNIRSVWIHNLGDALSSLAIVAGALVIGWTGAHWVDPLIGIGIAVFVLWSGVKIFRESTHILLEGLPHEIRLEDVARAILAVEGVQEVHDIHIWTIGSGLDALSCHVRVPDMHLEDCEKVLASLREILARDFQISHTTIQIERAGLPAQAGLYMPAPARSSSE